MPNSQSATNLSGNYPAYSPSSPTIDNTTTVDNRGAEQQQQPQQQQQQHSLKVGRRDNIHSRKKVKSPDLLETTFTMSTIEEEMEGVNIGQPLQT